MIRRISPHLSIYKPQFNSILSIFNRITGIFLFVIVFLVLSVDNTWISNTYTHYLASYFLGQADLYVLGLVGFLVSAMLVYHTLFLMEGFNVSLIRPTELESLDEYDLTQLYPLFIVKVLFVLSFSLLLTILLLL